MIYLKTAVYIILTVIMIVVFYRIFYCISIWMERSSHLKQSERCNKEENKKTQEKAQDIRKESQTNEQATEDVLPECLSVLGFTKVPDEKEKIRLRYRKLSKVYHPDGGGSEEEFQRLCKAWEEAKKIYGLDKKEDIG